MSKKASEFQEKAMAILYRGKEIFKPLNTGSIDEHVKCLREYIANIFFYTKNGTTIMLDAGYNYPRLKEKQRQDKALVDTISATIILQSYMSSLNRSL